ncbi:hypothetical protein [Mesorhizobium sp.]|uniref:hypothetical protein n=1 Tax=Mesorhizobium sp. TaxID=1871066 RepID=UPI000FE669EA|nr:hypothetical protein [Mesorhizobium sp.]RWQ44925.1 MAG: hypothetical protein EOS83_32315 [Mesorhizobium sp.]
MSELGKTALCTQIGSFGVADDPRFVHVFWGKTEVGGTSFFRLGISLIVGLLANLAPLLCRVVFVGEPPLGVGFDLIGLMQNEA